MKNQKLHETWQKRIKEYESSGMTIKAWCGLNALSVHQFQYWRKKFRASKVDSQSKLVAIDLNKMVNTKPEETAIMINIGTVRLEVKTGFNPSLLKDLVKALMEVC